MRKAFSILMVASVALAGLSSCNVMEEPQLQREQQGPHSAFFDGKVAELMDESGTKGLSLVAMPDWRNTATSHIHLFENGKEGHDPVMTIDSEDNRVAHFSATFGEEEEVLPIIAPTKAGESYVYNGIIAPSDESGAFVVPAVQYPDSEKISGKPNTGVSLIDPDADFLIGKSIQSKAAYSSDDSVNLTFVRPVSLFRLAIINLGEGEKIQEVSFTTDKALTGKFTKDKVNFEDGTVAFDKSEGSETVTLKYDNADPKSIFYAYFVICPVENAIVKTVVVKTDKYVYTKEYTEGKSVNFNSSTFYSIAVNMKDVKPSDGDEREAQTLVFDPAETSFEIGGEVKDFVEPVLSGNKTNTITYASSDEEVATVDAQGNVTFLEAGDVVISATAAENEQYKEGTGSYIVHVTKPATQTLTFSPATASYQIGSGDFTAPVLSGAETDVTYASSNAGVATVDELTGKVTIIAAGETTITATAEKTAAFFGATASYVLTVTAAPAPVATKFYKVKPGDIKAGKDYLIVSNGHALKNDNGSISDVAVTDVDGIIELENCDGLVWTSGTATKVDSDYPGYTYTNGGKKLNRKSTDLQLATPSDEKYYNFDYSGSEGSSTFMCGTHYYAYYSTSSSKWTNSTSSKSTTLYCSEKPEDEPVVPPTGDGSYVLVKSATDITSGTYILATKSASGKYYFFDKTVSGKFKSDDMSDSIDGNKIASNSATDAYAVTITRSGDNLQINVPGKGYMYVNGSDIAFLDNSDSKADHIISSVSSSTGDCKLGNKGSHSSTTYYLDYGGSSGDYHFRYATSRTSGTSILLFRLDGSEGEGEGEGEGEEDEPAGTVTYTKVTSAPADWSGTYLFVKESSNVALAYNKTNFKTSVSINNGKIQSDDLEAYQLTVTKSSVVDGMYEVKTTNGKYVYWYSSAFLNDYNTGTRTGSNTYYCSFSLKDGGDVTMYSTRTGSGGSVNYITYQDSKFTFNTTSTNTIQLYRLDGSEGEGEGEGGEEDEPTGTVTYTKVTKFTSGKTYVIAEGTTALRNNGGSHAGYSISGKVSGSTLALTEAEAQSLEWTATANDAAPTQGEYTLNNGSYYLRRAKTSNNAALEEYSSSNVAYFVWTLNDSGNNLFQKNSSGQYTFYLDYSSSSWTANTQTATNALVVYEKGNRAE